MSQEMVNPLTYLGLLKKSFSNYFMVLKQAWPLFLLAPLPHLIVPWILQFNYVVGWALVIGSILFTWYLFTVILFRADAGFNNTRLSYPRAFSAAVQRYLCVLGGNVLFFALLTVIILVEYALWLSVEVTTPTSALFLIVVFVVANAFLFALVYFAIPIIILDKKRILPSFGKSASLVKRSWFRTFCVLFTLLAVVGFIAVIGIALTGDNRMTLFTAFDYIYQLIAYPLIISTTLVLLYDLKTREPKKKTY